MIQSNIVELSMVQRGRQFARSIALIGLFLLVWAGSGCSFGRGAPTRTPVPTWTPTSIGQQAAVAAPVVEAPTATPVVAVVAPTNTPEPPTATPEPPTAVPTDTVVPEAPPAEEVPTETPTPEATPTAAFAFALEAAEKFPTNSLAANVVRIYLYAYSPADLGLAGYTLQVLHNGAPLTVDEVSAAGAPEQTRTEPSPYTRFTNMSVVFVEPQAGRWEIQLIDGSRNPAGPAVAFDLTADELTRELYVRYRQE
ncbi:MAG: hypothetical protein KDE53_15435 [Caldilineaceae bacterium]|nr:hypothetical protein [Caldilineaceae bacterium]